MAGEINRRLDRLKRTLTDRTLAKVGYDQFVQVTPRRTGNAQNSTELRDNFITANYPYAIRLEEGYSKQAPKGMVEPTIKHVQQYIKRQERK